MPLFVAVCLGLLLFVCRCVCGEPYAPRRAMTPAGMAEIGSDPFLLDSINVKGRSQTPKKRFYATSAANHEVDGRRSALGYRSDDDDDDECGTKSAASEEDSDSGSLEGYTATGEMEL